MTTPFPVIGIGASAGGLDAVKDMLAALPRDARMAYVLVLHPPQAGDSCLNNILSRVSPLPLSEAEDGMRIDLNRIYMPPAGCDIALHDGRLRLTPRTEGAGHHRPIDHLFHSLAAQLGHKAIGVVLSGTSPDGVLGIQAIEAAGGVTLAQNDTAQRNGMPCTAVQTASVDFVLRPADIARELARIAVHPTVAPSVDPEAEKVPDLTPVIELLQEATGVDFTHYKRNTLYRRIRRRIVLHELNGLADYMRLLENNPAEVKELHQDILISVTSFFRDPEAFEALKKEVFPALTHDRSPYDPVRIWTLGCSTGEEAYSLAMAFAEFCEEVGRSIPIQVFATDLNPVSIEKARTGFYLRRAVAEVSSERLRRFFVELDGGYRIANPIRDACIFACHNVLEDRPFSRIDLVSCRNMLIYLGAELQRKVLPVLHHALRPNGFLWLGTSEALGSHRDLFDLKNAPYRMYAKKSGAGAALPVISAQATRALPQGGASTLLGAVKAMPRDPQNEVDRTFISRFAPPGIVKRNDFEMLQFCGDTSSYLAHVPEMASVNLLADSDGAFDVEGVGQLKQELTATREYLRSAIEQQEAANEELQSANERMQSANEELQRINEALESSREQAQASNKELSKANDELHRRNAELVHTNTDLINLLSSDQVAIMERQIQNMAQLIDDMLDVTRITLPQIKLRRMPFDAAATVRRVAEQYEVVVQGKQQKLRLQLFDGPLYIEGDEIRFGQLVGNLVYNASRYTPPGGDIWITAERAPQAADESGITAGEELLIRVTDNGIGIELDELTRVFDLVTRAARSIDRRYGGLGVGLALVKRLVELHGGRVEAHSSGAGTGSEFIVRLPLLRLDSEYAQPGAGAPKRADDAGFNDELVEPASLRTTERATEKSS